MPSTLYKLKEFNKKTLMPKGYKANNTIFRVAIFLVGIFLIYAGITMPDDNAYFECKINSPMPCENPFYRADPCPFANALECSQSAVPQGVSLGQQPPVWYGLAFPISACIMLVAVALNHFLYNRGWKYENNNKD